MASAPEELAAAARKRYFPAVEGMRAVAALSVLAGHAIYLTHPLGGQVSAVGQRLAPLGVVVFFVISGFLIYRPFIAARGRGHSVGAITPNYLKRRAVRIVPAYWVALTVFAIWPGLNGLFSGQWWVSYGFLQIYSPHWLGLGLGPAWTLCVELTFYLALPLIAAMLQSRGVRSGHEHALRWEFGVLGGLAALSLIWRMLFFNHAATEYLGITLLGTFSWFAVGMLLAAIQLDGSGSLDRLRKAIARPELCWTVAAALFGLLLTRQVFPADLMTTGNVLFESIIFVAIAGLMMAPAVFGDGRSAVRLVLANRWIVYLGTVSYGIYLYHLPIVEQLLTTSIVTSSSYRVVTLCALALPVTVALASASWFLVERPLMRRMKSAKALAGAPNMAPHVREVDPGGVHAPVGILRRQPGDELR